MDMKSSSLIYVFLFPNLQDANIDIVHKMQVLKLLCNTNCDAVHMYHNQLYSLTLDMV